MTTDLYEQRARLPIEVNVADHVKLGDGALERFTRWLFDSADDIQRGLHASGAVLLRGTPVTSAETFERSAAAICGELACYVEGSSERQRLATRVYTSTEYPSQFHISLHNELSYARWWPSRLCFACIKAPEAGGETPLADSRRVLDELPTDLVSEFEERGLWYTRNLRSKHTRGLGLSWQAVFETSDRDAVASYCERGGIEFTWRADEALRLGQAGPVTAFHPETGERVWFNQADQFHPTNLGADEAAQLVEVVGEDNLPTNVTFADGGRIDPAHLDEVRRLSWRCAATFPWRVADLLVVDNMLAAHGRMPFTGERLVLVAMG